MGDRAVALQMSYILKQRLNVSCDKTAKSVPTHMEPVDYNPKLLPSKL